MAKIIGSSFYVCAMLEIGEDCNLRKDIYFNPNFEPCIDCRFCRVYHSIEEYGKAVIKKLENIERIWRCIEENERKNKN